MQFDPFYPLGLWPEAEAKEKRRRENIGRLGRLREDLPSVISAWLLIAAVFSALLVPWFVGVYAIGNFVAHSYPHTVLQPEPTR